MENIMRKTLLIGFVIAVASLAFGQSTTVTGTLADANSQVLFGSAYTITFAGVSGSTWSGGTLTTTFTGTTDGSGNFSVSLPSNTAISPSGSGWNFQFCPPANV